MEKGLLLFDLDFTLLNSKREISERTLTALKACRNSGYYIGFCTSRGIGTISVFRKLVEPDVIVCNAGAVSYFKNRIIHSITFSVEEAQWLFNEAYEIFGSDVEMTADTDDEEKANMLASVDDNCSVMKFSDIPWFKFSPKNATKEKAILFLSEYLNVPLCNMISFGDDFSDVGMLKICGVGVAMGNAIPEVKEIADVVTLDCDHDGVAVFLEEKVLL